MDEVILDLGSEVNVLTKQTWELMGKLKLRYFCNKLHSCGLCLLILHISHQGPRAWGKGLGAPLASYSANTGHCSFE
jgi:hypothetical protein